MSSIGEEEESLARLISRRATHRGVTTRILGGTYRIHWSTDDKRALVQVQIINILSNKIEHLRDIDDKI